MVKILYKDKIIVKDVLVADNFWLRLSGYMFRKTPHVPGILFEPANAMQTTFMWFDLDLVFLSHDNLVIKVLRQVRPWRHTWFYFRTAKVLEVPAGVIPKEIIPGDFLDII